MTEINAALGIDIGGTNTVFGLIDRTGKIYLKDSIPTHSQQPAEELFERLFKRYRELVQETGLAVQLVGIGVGAPNGNYYNGTVELPPNLSWEIVDIVGIIKKHFDVPAAVTNDANAAALGEMTFGAAKGMKNFVEITLGTGLGSGIVVNGQVVYGHDGFAGEIGHVNVKRNGRRCGCGNYGCLETYASANGIRRNVFKALSRFNQPNALRDISFNELTSRRIYEEALKGNRVAIDAFQYTGQMLGQALANTVAHLSPEAIIFFGGLAQAGEMLFKPVRENMEANLFPVFKNKVKLLVSALPPGDAAILGASACGAWALL